MANCAFSLTVPVVGSIWLSTVISAPVASWILPARSKAVTGSFSPACSFFITAGRLSSGMLKITVIGCSCVITTSPFGVARAHDVAEVHLAQAERARRSAR